MNAPFIWRPSANFDNCGYVDQCGERAYHWRKKDVGFLSVVIVDDMYNRAIFGVKPDYPSAEFARGMDEYSVQFAIDTLLSADVVQEVIITTHDSSVLRKIKTHRQRLIDESRLCVLLDIYIAATSPGEEVAITLRNEWRLPQQNVAQFSTGDSENISRLGFTTVVDKPIGKSTEASHKNYRAALVAAIDGWAKLHQTVFKAKLGEEKLLGIGKTLSDEFHHDKCHALSSWKDNAEYCDKKLRILASKLPFADFCQELGDVLEEVKEDFFAPLLNPGGFEPGIAFSISKTISRFGTTRDDEPDTCVPGHWLTSLLKVRNGTEMSLREFPLKAGQPLVGFLRAFDFLMCSAEISVFPQFNDKMLRIDLQISPDTKEVRGRGLKGFAETLISIFAGMTRPLAGDSTAAFQALADGGVSLAKSEYADGVLTISLELKMVQVR